LNIIRCDKFNEYKKYIFGFQRKYFIKYWKNSPYKNDNFAEVGKLVILFCGFAVAGLGEGRKQAIKFC